MAKYAGANSKSNTNWGTGKFITKNNKIRVDHRTKEFFELGRLAPETYKKVMEETKAIKAIKNLQSHQSFKLKIFLRKIYLLNFKTEYF